MSTKLNTNHAVTFNVHVSFIVHTLVVCCRWRVICTCVWY